MILEIISLIDYRLGCTKLTNNLDGWFSIDYMNLSIPLKQLATITNINSCLYFVSCEDPEFDACISNKANCIGDFIL